MCSLAQLVHYSSQMLLQISVAIKSAPLGPFSWIQCPCFIQKAAALYTEAIKSCPISYNGQSKVKICCFLSSLLPRFEISIVQIVQLPESTNEICSFLFSVYPKFEWLLVQTVPLRQSKVKFERSIIQIVALRFCTFLSSVASTP